MLMNLLLIKILNGEMRKIQTYQLSSYDSIENYDS